jgi:O-antigen/teichoic acid export membrane protein
MTTGFENTHNFVNLIERKLIAAIANLVNLIIRVSLAMSLAPRFGIAFVWYAVPIGWFANWVISFARYRTDKWQMVNPLSG